MQVGISFDDFVRDYVQDKQPHHANVGSQSKFLEPQRNGTAATHLFRYEDQDGLTQYLESRLGITVATERLNTSRAEPLPLSAKTESTLRHKYANDFRLYSGIGSNGAYRPEPTLSPVS